MPKLNATKKNISIKNDLNDTLKSLNALLKKRNGGAINLRGIHYQLLYACYLILNVLHEANDEISLTLEGIEDLDMTSPKLYSSDKLYIQLKSSENKMNAADFWTLGVLQNFLEVYEKDKGSSFKVVYNMKIADGNLTNLIQQKQDAKSLPFWTDKIISLGYKDINVSEFLAKVSFEQFTISELSAKILSILFQKWNVNAGTENQFIRALFFCALEWSKNRAMIKHADIKALFSEIMDSYSKAPVNEAAKNNWIEHVSYSKSNNINLDYYDGKSAMPYHIADGLPARRKAWEKTIFEKLAQTDVAVIKSSSGQGKSTLAWQTGFNIADKNAIYQLHLCNNYNTANSIVEFIQSRIHIGELPVVIIDGLNTAHSEWPLLVEKTSHLPVKYLITSRNEDWFRYGADISRINLQIIEISLSIDEGKDIFHQLKSKNKLHSAITDWQPVWEQVHKNGLLIEYTFLLTQGEMLRDRLRHQLKTLNSEIGSAEKIEILRLVSLADCINIKLKTSTLLSFVSDRTGFQTDRDQILNELENEYFLNFNGQYITGLHPVRSEHLKDLLHTNLPLEDSLLNLYKIVDETAKHDFFIYAPLLLTANSKNEFYTQIAEVLSESKFSEMVYALDGILHGEPQRYWQENRQLFDDADKTGGIELFIMATVPFTKLDTLDELAGLLPAGLAGNMKYLSDTAKKLPTYTFDESDVVLFASALQKKLKERKNKIDSYEGLEFLIKWFKTLKLDFSIPISLDADALANDLPKMEIQEAKELFLYIQITDPVRFKKFVSRFKKDIISYLKVHTQSVTISEIKNDLHINYLVNETDIDKLNEQSVFRIQTVHSFLPYYANYCTDALLLPFPSEQIIEVVRRNSHKKLTAAAIGSLFDMHLNQIWISTIRRNYQETSAFDWQKSIIKLRKNALQWCKSFIRIIEAMLEANLLKKKMAIASLDKERESLQKLIVSRKPYPEFGKKYFEKSTTDQKEIDSWFSSLNNTNNQILNFFMPETDHNRHLAVINLKAVVFNLEKMQLAFREIESKSIAYFDFADIEREEIEYYNRLYRTVSYYISKLPIEDQPALQVARKVIHEWWDKANASKMQHLSEILNGASLLTGYNFHLPSGIHETSTLKTTTIAINDFDFADNDSFFRVSLALGKLANFESDFITILSVKNNIVSGGLQFKKEYFEQFLKVANNDEEASLDDCTPIPITIEEEMLSLLPGINMPQKQSLDIQKEAKAKMIFDLWKLMIARERLDIKAPLEKKWLDKMEDEYEVLLNSNMSEDSGDFEKWIDKGLRGAVYSEAEFVNQLFNIIE